MSYIDIIAIVIFAGFMPVKFISDYHRIFKPWKEQKINQVKEWNRQRNNRTRELIKQIKDWNNHRNQKLRAWKEWGRTKLRAWKEWGRTKFKNFKAWWKKNVSPEWKKATPFKKIYIVFSCIIGVILFILFLTLCSQILLLPFGKSNITEIDSNFALAFLGTVSGGVALFTGYIAILRSETNTQQNEIANRQANIAEKGLITDRINKATEALGKSDKDGEPVREVRLGALYALESIAQDSIDNHIRIMQIICAYIRVSKHLANSRVEAQAVREDIRAALIIIGLRGEWTEDQRHLKKEEEQKYRLDLRHCNFNNADLSNANLSNARLSDATLEAAMLSGATLKDALLICTNLTNAKLDNTDFKDAYTASSFAYEGDFLTCLNLTQEQLNVMYCGTGVDIFTSENPKNLIRPDHWPTDNLTLDEFKAEYNAWLEKTYPNFVIGSSKN